MAGPASSTTQFLAADAAADLIGDAVVGHVGEALAGSTLAQRVMAAVKQREDGVVAGSPRKPAKTAPPVSDTFWPVATDLWM